MDQEATPKYSTLVILQPEANIATSYRKVKRFILENMGNEVISRFRRNKPITSQDIEDLEKLLFDGGERGTKEDFVSFHGNKEPIGYFVRGVVGLDQEAAMEPFLEFLKKDGLNTQQKAFINLVIDYLSAKGVMPPEKLMEHPFTEMHPQGVIDVFEKKDVEALMQIVKRINENAVPKIK